MGLRTGIAALILFIAAADARADGRVPFIDAAKPAVREDGLLRASVAPLAAGLGTRSSGLADGAGGSLLEAISVPLIAPESSVMPLLEPVSAPVSGQGASLFGGDGAGTLFAPVAPRETRRAALQGDPWNFPADRLKDLISSAESGEEGYDAVQYGAVVLPRKRPTAMTLGEIYAWIDATPGQPHAIGRYQFIPATLRRVAAVLGAPGSARFSPDLQDRLADVLLEEAGLSAFMARDLSRKDFMNNLAAIWAGLPNSSGRSHYHGYAGNRATMSWARFDSEMSEIFRD